jgi:hypothetical protein
MNRWLIIIIILFICFIVIPISLKLFNIKEGFSINDIGNRVNDVRNNVNSIKSSQIVDRQFLKEKIDAAEQRIKMNDEENEKRILDAIDNKIQTSSRTVSAPAPSAPAPSNNIQIGDYNAKLGDYNAKLGEYNTGLNDPTKGIIPKIDIMNGFISAYNTNLTQNNTKLGELNSGLNDPANGMIPKIDSMNANIVAYNTTNLSNTGAIASMGQTIQATNASYLSNINSINDNILKMKEKLDEFDYQAINTKIDAYTTEQLRLTNLILSNIDTYKLEDDVFKTELRDRLKMA